jgi:hypothetical protein
VYPRIDALQNRAPWAGCNGGAGGFGCC